MNQTVIGRKDVADLPDFGLENVQIKVDSGAYTSSVDYESAAIKEIEGEKIEEA